MFRIVITEAVERETLTAKDWKVIGKEEKTPGVFTDLFGYTPQELQRQTVEVKRLEQAVETLDMAAVIRAINGLK